MMERSQNFEISLPIDLAKHVERKIESGDYGSASDVMEEGLRSLIDREASIENWLRQEVVPGHQEYLADTGGGVRSSEILQRTEARRVVAASS